MKTALLATLIVLGGVLTSYAGESTKPTEAQLEIFEQTIKPFLTAYYSEDYETAWVLGKVAYSNSPYDFKDREEFISVVGDFKKVPHGDSVLLSRDLRSLSLNWVESQPDGKFFHVMATYKHTMLDTETNMQISCEMIEHNLFRVDMEYKDFDRFASLEDQAYQCFEGQAM